MELIQAYVREIGDKGAFDDVTNGSRLSLETFSSVEDLPEKPSTQDGYRRATVKDLDEFSGFDRKNADAIEIVELPGAGTTLINKEHPAELEQVKRPASALVVSKNDSGRSPDCLFGETADAACADNHLHDYKLEKAALSTTTASHFSYEV